MLKLLRRKSFRKSKDFKTSSPSAGGNNPGNSASQEVASSSHLVLGDQGQYTCKEIDSRYNSWDRRSQTSYNPHRYYSISTNTLGCESPPEILQYARPPENLTSPVRESNGLLQDSLTPSPGLQKKVAKEARNLLRRSGGAGDGSVTARIYHPRTESAGEPKRRSVISSLRQSFRKKNRKSTGDPQQQQQPVVRKSSAPAAAAVNHSQHSISGGGGGGSYQQRRSGSVSSVKSQNSGQHHNQVVASGSNRQLLPGRSASPGKPVQVVAPFQQQLPSTPETAAPAATTGEIPVDDDNSAERDLDNLSGFTPSSKPVPAMRDPATLQQHQQANNNIHNNINSSKGKNSSNNNNHHHLISSGVMDSSATAMAPPPQHQRRLPQTPKQSSVLTASGRSSSRDPTSRASAVVNPVVMNSHSSSSTSANSHSHHHHGHGSSGHPPKPAQRLSLRNKVGNILNGIDVKISALCFLTSMNGIKIEER